MLNSTISCKNIPFKVMSIGQILLLVTALLPFFSQCDCKCNRAELSFIYLSVVEVAKTHTFSVPMKFWAFIFEFIVYQNEIKFTENSWGNKMFILETQKSFQKKKKVKLIFLLISLCYSLNSK